MCVATNLVLSWCLITQPARHPLICTGLFLACGTGGDSTPISNQIWGTLLSDRAAYRSMLLTVLLNIARQNPLSRGCWAGLPEFPVGNALNEQVSLLSLLQKLNTATSMPSARIQKVSWQPSSTTYMWEIQRSRRNVWAWSNGLTVSPCLSSGNWWYYYLDRTEGLPYFHSRLWTNLFCPRASLKTSLCWKYDHVPSHLASFWKLRFSHGSN